jgi:ribosome-associated translation inhibitor RaiA
MMTIDIRGIAGNARLQAHVRRQVAFALARLPVVPVSAQAFLFDENGPRGGDDIRCTLTVRLPYRPSLRAEHLARTHRRAFDEALEILERQLERYVERTRESRRRPKKYYVATRLLGTRPKRAATPGARAR